MAVGDSDSSSGIEDAARDHTDPGDGGTDAATPGQAEPRHLTRRGARQVGVTVLAVLTLLGVLTSTLAVWSHRLLLNTDAWVATVGPLAEDPEITDVVAQRLTDELLAVTDAEAKVRAALPDRAGVLAGPLTSAADQFIGDAVAQVLASEQFATLWTEANRLAHESAVRVLRGEPMRGLQVTDGTVSLNLLPVMDDVLRRVNDVAPDLVTDGRPIPEITYQTPVDEARAELSAAIGRDLPEDFGVITLFHSDQLAAAQDAVALFDRIVWVLPAVTLACAAATIALSRHRRRAVVVLAIGTVGMLVLAVAGAQAGRHQLLGMVSDPESRAAVGVTIATLLADLRVMVRVLIGVGSLAAVVAWLAGDGRVAVALRHAVRGLRDSSGIGGGGGDAGAGTGAGTGDAMPWVHRHLRPLQVAGVAAAAAVLVFGNPSFDSLALTLVALAAYQGVLWLVGGRDVGGTAAAGPVEPRPAGTEA